MDALIEPTLVLDMFIGVGTTAVVAKRMGRDYIGFDVNPTYVKMARNRVRATQAGVSSLSRHSKSK